MKKAFLTFCLACLTTGLLADTGTNDLSIRLAAIKASGDVNRIMSALPDAEILWSQNPKEYFEFMNTAVKSLGVGAETNNKAEPQMLVIFTNVLSKPISTNYQVIMDTLGTQADTACSCAGALDRSNHKNSDLLILARYIGSIQGQIIPGFNMLAMTESGQVSQKAMDENDQHNIMVNWQRTLQSNKRHLEFLLFISYIDRSDSNLTEQIISAARLSNDESKKMLSGARTPNG